MRKPLAIAIVRCWFAKFCALVFTTWGGLCPSPSTWGPPETAKFPCLVLFRLLCDCVCEGAVWSSSVLLCWKYSVSLAGQAMGLRLWGLLANPCILTGFCGFGAVGEVGRSFGTSRCLSPRNRPPKVIGVSHGPLRPSWTDSFWGCSSLSCAVWYAPETQDAVLTHVAL